MSKYVFCLVKFTDGDWRVYHTSVATKARIDAWNYVPPDTPYPDPDDVQAEIVLTGRKKVLIGMAKLARADYVEEQVQREGGDAERQALTREYEEPMADRTKTGQVP